MLLRYLKQGYNITYITEQLWQRWWFFEHLIPVWYTGSLVFHEMHSEFAVSLFIKLSIYLIIIYSQFMLNLFSYLDENNSMSSTLLHIVYYSIQKT